MKGNRNSLTMRSKARSGLIIQLRLQPKICSVSSRDVCSGPRFHVTLSTPISIGVSRNSKQKTNNLKGMVITMFTSKKKLMQEIEEVKAEADMNKKICYAAAGGCLLSNVLSISALLSMRSVKKCIIENNEYLVDEMHKCGVIGSSDDDGESV